MVGVDIIEIERVAAAATRGNFLQRVFTPCEIAYYRQKGERPQTLAALFCAKEAAAKALGVGFCGGVRLTDIETDHTPQGAPFYRFYGRASELAAPYRAALSLSHSREYAVAVCVLEEIG